MTVRRPVRLRQQAENAEAKTLAEAPQFVVGTVQYDTGTNAGFHPDGNNGGNLNRIVGNRFNDNTSGTVFIDAGCTACVVVANDLTGDAITDNGTDTVVMGNDVGRALDPDCFIALQRAITRIDSAAA